MSKIYVFGHKRPDTDSVTAAISLAYLKNKQGLDAEARVLGRLNNETKFALKYFNVSHPEYLNDVKTQIKDINYNKTILNNKLSIKKCFERLRKEKISGAPVVNDKNKLIGMISLKDVSSYFIDGDFISLNTSYDNIIDAVNGQEVLRFNEEIKGNIVVASYRSTTFLNNIDLHKNTILIVGDRHSILEYAVNSGVKMIIVVGNGEVKEEHLLIAKKNRVNIIRTKYDTFHTAKTINLSNYIEDILVTTDPIKFDENDYLSDFIEVNNEYKHTNYPIVDKKNNCLGVLRIVDVNDKNRKKVILVDHNELSQSVDGLDEADILEVIDHHKLGAMATNSPINFRIMAVGCTNTIIHSIYEQNNFPIPKDIAGIMLAGIISDTLMLKSPTTTQFDKQAVLRLSKIANVDFEKFGIEMFKAGSSIKGKSLEEILFTDFKVFKVGNIEAGIGQIFTTDYSSLKIDIEKFRELLNKTSINNDYLVVCLFITDIINNGSYIIFNDKAKHILEDSFNLDSLNQGAYMQDIVSRKKQILPPIIEVLQKK